MISPETFGSEGAAEGSPPARGGTRRYDSIAPLGQNDFCGGLPRVSTGKPLPLGRDSATIAFGSRCTGLVAHRGFSRPASQAKSQQSLPAWSLSENHLGEGDSPILLRGLRKIGTVPDGSRIGSQSGRGGSPQKLVCVQRGLAVTGPRWGNGESSRRIDLHLQPGFGGI